MNFDKLSSSELAIVLECLKASCEESFFPEWEFHAIFGIERDELRSVIKKWPLLNMTNDVDRLAVNNSINNLLGYPHNMEKHWPEYISVSKTELRTIFQKLKGGSKKGYVGNME